MNRVTHYRKQRMTYKAVASKGKRPRASAYVSAYVWTPARMPSHNNPREYTRFISRSAFIARVLGFLAFVLILAYAFAGSI